MEDTAVPNIKSAKKRLRQNEKRRAQNRTVKSAMKTSIRRLTDNLPAGDAGKVKKELDQAVVVINKTAQKGIIHKNKAARMTSRLTRRANKALETKEKAE